MRGKRQGHLIETYINIGMVIGRLRLSGDPVDKFDAVHEFREYKGAQYGFGTFRPFWDALQMGADLFEYQVWHGDGSVLGPAGPASFASARQFIDGRPGPRFRGFWVHASFLIALLDVRGLTSLFARITRFVTLGHGGSSNGCG